MPFNLLASPPCQVYPLAAIKCIVDCLFPDFGPLIGKWNFRQFALTATLLFHKKLHAPDNFI